MTTRITSSHENALKLYTVKIFGRIATAPGWIKDHTGPMESGQTEAQMKLEGRTSAGYPVVRVADLSKTPGAKVSVTLFDILRGKPIVGTRLLEGKGESLFSSSQDIEINLIAKPVDAGSAMDQKRINYDLLPLAQAQLPGYFSKLYNQWGIVHMAGARGSQTGFEWIIPTASDADFASIMVNPVLAPTYNRHLVIDGTGFVQGGQQLASIDSTDMWTMDHIEALSTYVDKMEYRMQPVRVVDDPLADYDPIKGILYLTPEQHRQLRTQNSGRTWTDMVKIAWARKDAGMKHPLFLGEVGLWNGILVRKMPTNHYVQFLPGESTNIITAANRYVANRNTAPTETSQTVNPSLTAGYAVNRALFMSAQALGYAIGKSEASNFYFELGEHRYNYAGTSAEKREMAGMTIAGMEKLRFVFQNGQGLLEPTDHGMLVVDSAVPL